MRFDVLTLFPDMFSAVIGESMIKRAIDCGKLEVNLLDIRDFAFNKHNSVDDYPYGGGHGMLMQFEPVYRAYKRVEESLNERPHVIYMSPKGRVFTHNVAVELSKHKNITIICGHYEGIDQRVIERIVDEEISIGDFVLTGGELPAMVIIDAISRQTGNVLSNETAHMDESFYNGLLEPPQYTRPATIMGMDVPEILLSGNHAEIEGWKRKMSLSETYKKRPDLLKMADLSEDDIAFLQTLSDLPSK